MWNNLFVQKQRCLWHAVTTDNRVTKTVPTLCSQLDWNSVATSHGMTTKSNCAWSRTNSMLRTYAWFPPFRCRFAVAVFPFRSYRCRCESKRKCWKRLSVYIGMKRPERWLVVRLRQNGKKRIRSCCYGTAVTAQRQVERQRRQWIFFT